MIYNNDCLEGLPDLDENSVDLVAADLPYGTTANQWDSVIPLEPLWEQLYRVAKEDAAFVMTASQPFTHELIASNKEDFRYDLVWNKKRGTNFLRANKQPLKTHEDIVVFYRKQPTYNPQKTDLNKTYQKKHKTEYTSVNHGHEDEREGTETKRGKYPTSVLEYSGVSNGFSSTNHPTEKPVGLFEWIIKSYSDEGDTVLDPAAGSGTTGVAAKKTGRDFIGYEIDEEYYETAQERICKTQKKRETAEKFFDLSP